MQTKLLIPAAQLYIIAIFAAVFTVVTVTFDVTDLGFPPAAGSFLTFLALLCSFITTVVLIIDVFKNNVSGKYLWTLGLLLSGGIAGLFYLHSRARSVPS